MSHINYINQQREVPNPFVDEPAEPRSQKQPEQNSCSLPSNLGAIGSLPEVNYTPATQGKTIFAGSSGISSTQPHGAVVKVT